MHFAELLMWIRSFKLTMLNMKERGCKQTPEWKNLVLMLSLVSLKLQQLNQMARGLQTENLLCSSTKQVSAETLYNWLLLSVIHSQCTKCDQLLAAAIHSWSIVIIFHQTIWFVESFGDDIKSRTPWNTHTNLSQILSTIAVYHLTDRKSTRLNSSHS